MCIRDSSKIIVKWFKGKEMALAMGLEMATARIGTTLAMVLTVPLADFFGSTDELSLIHISVLCILHRKIMIQR